MDPSSLPDNKWKKREIYLDFLRIISIYFVISQHGTYFHFEDTDNPGYYVRLIYNCLITIAVPVFFLISGATLLHKKESIRYVLRHRVLPFCLLIVICALIQGGVFWTYSGLPLQSLPYCVAMLGNGMTTSWFLWVYLAFLLLLPLVRTMAQNMTNSMFVYLIALQILLIGVLPSAYTFLKPSLRPVMYINNYLPFFQDDTFRHHGHMAWLFYVLTGYFLAHRVSLSQLTRPRLWMLAVAALLCLGTEACLLERIRIARGLSSIVECMIPIAILDALPAIALFCLARALCCRITCPAWGRKLLTGAASGVLLLFLFENIARYFTKGWEHEWASALGGSTTAFFTAGLGMRVLILLAGLAAGILLKQVPGIRRII